MGGQQTANMLRSLSFWDLIENMPGLHMEGPYFAMNQKGGQDPRYIKDPDPAEYEKICHPKFGAGSWQAMVDFAKDCRAFVPDVVMTVVDEPVTSKEKQARCQAICDRLGVRLRIRPFEK